MPVQYVLSCPKVAGNSNGWSDILSKKEVNKKGGEKTMGGIRKKRKKKEKRKRQQNKRKEREGRGEEDRMKNRKKKKEKRVGITKGCTVLGLNPVHWYIYMHSSNFYYHWS